MAPPDLTPTTTTPPSPGRGASAGYGRSCTNCSRAKCKCILRPSGEDCERCHRLGRECQPIVTTRRRTDKKAMSSRTAQLEEKLDDLVSILRSTQAQGSHAAFRLDQHTQNQHQNHNTNQATARNVVQDHDSPTSRLDHLATAATSASHPQNTTGPTSKLNANYHQSDEKPEPTAAEAELYLQKFRGWLKNFPFMYLPPETTAAELRQERPFLWLCIMNITSMSVPQMVMLKERVRRQLADIMVIRHEPSFDVVLGLLTILGWATACFGPGGKPFLILYLEMALSAVSELGLLRSPEEEQHYAACFKIWGKRQPPHKPRTTEEKRALLALWLLSVVITTFIGKTESLPWTSYMQESLEFLEREMEYEQDGVLTTLVRMQLIGDESHKLLMQDFVRGDSKTHITPSYVFTKSLMERLRRIQGSLSPILQSNPIIQLQGHASEALVTSMGLFGGSMPETQRIDGLYSCLRAVRAWYDVFLSIPLSEVPSHSFSVFIQLFMTQMVLYRLTTMEDSGLDRDMLRNTADICVILDRCIERFENMETVYPLKTGDDESHWTMYQRAVKILSNMKMGWEPIIAQAANGLPTPNSQIMNASNFNRGGAGMVNGMGDGGGGGPGPGSGSGSGPGPGRMNIGEGPSMAPGLNPAVNPMLGDPMNMDFGDMNWMTDMFTPWEF